MIARLGTLAVLAALCLSSCEGTGGGDAGARSVAEGCPKRPARVPAVSLHYRVESTASQPGSFGHNISALCARLRLLGLRDVSVGPKGPELVMRAPRPQEPDARAAAMSGALNFFDWDANATGRSDPAVPFSGTSALFDAVEAASRMKPRAEVTDVPAGTVTSLEDADRLNDTTPVERHYLFGADRRLLAGPAWNLGAFATARGRTAPGTRILTVPRGILVVEAERSRGEPAAGGRYFVLEDDAGLSRTSVASSAAKTDQVTGEPVVTLMLTETGRAAFAALTRRIADRSAQQVALAGSSPDQALQHLAIALDDRVVSLPAIDARRHPQGLDGRAGVQIGGLGTRTRARRLALMLQGKPLPGHLVPLTPPR